MNDVVVCSKKINLSKKIKLAWIVLAVVLAIVSAFAIAKYSGYKKAQDEAVSFVCLTTNQFNSYKDDPKKMVEKMYDFFNPTYYNVNVKGMKLNNSNVVSSARDADRALGKLMNEAGYDCYYGSDFLKYVGFADYTKNNTAIPFIVWAVLAMLALCITLWCKADAKKEMIVGSDRIVCKKGDKIEKEFFIKDINSVESASKKGILISGNGIKYKINYLENAEEVKTSIMNSAAATTTERTAKVSEIKHEVQSSNADELKKYKELFDAGVITKEEFDTKKTQLLGL